jgi:hypothetical protein
VPFENVADCGFTDIEPEFGQFIFQSTVPPVGILSRQADHKCFQFRWGAGTSHLTFPLEDPLPPNRLTMPFE